MIASRLFKTGVLLAGVLLSSLAAQALQIIPLSIETLSSNATLVVHGIVSSKTVGRDTAGRIYTSVDVNVQELWKGHLSTNHLTIVHGGGVLGDEVAEVSGQAEYEIGEEVICFLVLNVRGEAVSVGLAQGKFHVWKDARTGEKFAQNGIHGLRPGSAASAPLGQARIIQNLPLQELHRRALGAGP